MQCTWRHERQAQFENAFPALRAILPFLSSAAVGVWQRTHSAEALRPYTRLRPYSARRAMLQLASSAAEGAWTLQHSTTDTTRLRHAGARHTRFTARAAVGPGNARRADGSSCQGGVHVRQSRAFSRILIILCSYMWGGPMNCEFGCDFQLNNGLVFRYRFNFWSRNAWLHVCVFAEESFSVCPVHFCIAYRNKNRE